jgi:DNA modification methylase
MNRVKIPITSIIVKDRQRLDVGDLDDLSHSLQQYGLIQPVVINQENRLIAGGRRLAAAIKLGWGTIDVVFRETLGEDDLSLLELEENLRRLDETWQERCLHIAHIHRLKQQVAGLDGQTWGQRLTGEMLGISGCHINFNLQMAALLTAELGPDKKPLPNARFWPCATFADAWRIHLKDREDDLLAELGRRHAAMPTTAVDDFSTDTPIPIVEITPPDVLAEERKRYESNPLNTIPFDVYWAEKQSFKQRAPRVNLSKRLFLGDSIFFMNDPDNAGAFDHIITDIPYGIDMDYLDQQNPHGGMVGINSVKAEHTVDGNKKLIADFFPAAWHATKDKAFVITWCDQMLWQYMYDIACANGFSVQRWPIVWHKTSPCMNQCAQYNFTKNTEIAMVCRKPNTLLREPQVSSVIVSGKDDLCDALDHPFAKPYLIWEFLCSAVSLEGQLILDPFAGHGSGVISMLRMNRNVFGVELNEKHYHRLVENVKNLHYLRLNPLFTFV